MGAANPGSKGQGQVNPPQGGKGQGQVNPPQGGKGQGQVNPQAPMGKGQGQPMPPQGGKGKGQVNPQAPMGKGQGQPMPPQSGSGKGQVQQPGIGVNIMGGVTTPYTIGPNGQPLGGPAYANGKGRVQQPPLFTNSYTDFPMLNRTQANSAPVLSPQQPMQTQQDLMAQRAAFDAANPQPVNNPNDPYAARFGVPGNYVGTPAPQMPMQTQQQMQAELKKQLVGNLSPQQVQQAIPRPAPQQLRGLPQNAAQVPQVPMTQQIAQPNQRQEMQRALQQFRPGMAQPKPIAQQGGVYNNPNQSSIMGSNLRGRR